jgi:hypothetical protein
MRHLALIAAVALAGCKSNPTFDLPACSGAFRVTTAFVPLYDSAELRETNGEKPLETAGKRCAKATDVAACEQKVAAKTSKHGWSNGSHGREPGHHYIVATRGDEVLLIDNELIRVERALAPIDTPGKAATVAFVQRALAPACTSSVRKVEDGFEVFLKTESCLGAGEEIIRVNTNGTTSVIKSEFKPGTCVG